MCHLFTDAATRVTLHRGSCRRVRHTGSMMPPTPEYCHMGSLRCLSCVSASVTDAWCKDFPFFAHCGHSLEARIPTANPKFCNMEYEDQWQRHRGCCSTTLPRVLGATAAVAANNLRNLTYPAHLLVKHQTLHCYCQRIDSSSRVIHLAYADAQWDVRAPRLGVAIPPFVGLES